jgi:hypothetical protein
MSMLKTCSSAGLVMFALLAGPLPAAAAKSCIYPWAVPGDYVISGNFRGSVESTTARLTSDCRVVLSLPGVFAGATIRRAGPCLSFTFKIEGQKQVFTAQWCEGYGVVPWQGRQIRASVTPKPAPGARDWEKSQNFQSRFKDGSDF